MAKAIIRKNNINERLIVDLNSLKILIDSAVQHSAECPQFQLDVIIKSWKTLELKCKTCNFSIVKRKEDLTHELPLNEALAVGAYCGGIGFTALKFLLNTAEIEVINKKTFIRAEERIGRVIKMRMDPELTANNSEERRLALESDEYHKVGEEKIPYITVIVDGGWSKRCYGHSYNSTAGCAVIIGARTKKVLYVGYRIKTCSICDESHKLQIATKDHLCFKNWSDSAQSMEASIIVKGFQESYTNHGLIYQFVIGDADSSVYAQLQTQVVYPRRIPIEKIDCANHAVRGLNTKIHSIINNTSFSKASRDMISKHVNRFGKDLRSAITHNGANRYSTDLNSKTTPLTLAEDIANVPAHVYGDHGKCKSYFCKGGGENCFDQFKSTPAGVDLLAAFGRLANRSSRLIYDTTSNLAESFMAIAAKYISGKRINYSQRGSYARRVHSAVLAYNNGAFWPLKRLRNSQNGHKIWIKAEKYFRQAKVRSKIPRPKKGPFGRCSNKTSNKEAQMDYGPSAIQGKLTDAEVPFAVEKLMNDLQVTPDMCAKIQSETIGQNCNVEWKFQRRNRLTASNAGKIYKMRDNTNNRCTLQAILYPRDLSRNENIIRGINKEPNAKELYTVLYNVEISECGLFVSVDNGVLGASPDGLIGSGGIIEIKCPNCCVEDIPLRKDKFLVKVSGKLQVNRNHRYYYQVVMQLYVTERSYCDFFVYYEGKSEENPSYFVERISRDNHTDDLWIKMKEKLLKFYRFDMAPEIADPVFPSTKQFRIPEYRLKAMAKKPKENNINTTI